MVKQIYHHYGQIGFDYDLNISRKAKPKPQAMKRQSNDMNDPPPKKKQKLSESECKESTGNAKRSKTKGKLASTWRWSPARRTVAVNKANAIRLFDITVDGGKRDAKIEEITKEMNQLTDIDVNFALLTAEHYRKEIYKIQRKVIKLGVKDEGPIALLPDEEQELFKQLKDAGQVEEADKCTVSGNTCLVHSVCLYSPNGPSPNLQYLLASFSVTLRANANNSRFLLQGLSKILKVFLMKPNSLSTNSLSLLNILFQRAYSLFVCDSISLNGAKTLICSVERYPKSAPTYSPSFVRMPALFQYEFWSIL